MIAYRFFVLDRSNRFRGAEIIEARDDAAARAQAESMQADLGSAGFELWQGARPVLQRRAQAAA